MDNLFSLVNNKLKLITWISLTSLMLVMASPYGGPKLLILNYVICIFISYFLIFRMNVLSKLDFAKNKKIKLLSVIFTITSCMIFYKEFTLKYLVSSKFGDIIDYVGMIFCFFSLFAIYLFWNWFFNNIARDSIDWLRNIKFEEKIFLITFSIVFSLLIIFIFCKTSIFYYPEYQGQKVDFDVLFTSDSGLLYRINVFVNMAAGENDIRQPLFALFAMPLGITAHIVSTFLGFVKDSQALILQLLQVFMLGITVILLGRLLGLKKVKDKIYFYLIISLSYSFLLWSLILEQYIVAYFFLIAFISNLNNEKYKRILYLGALGTLTTSVILFSLLLKKFDWKNIFQEIIKIGCCFLVLIIFVGQFRIITGSIESLVILSNFLGKNLTFVDKFYQFVNFVALCFIPPKIALISGGGVPFIQLAAIEGLNKFGVFIIIFVTLGFLFNRNNKFAQICYGWVVFSFLVLCIVGWGSAENGMILYGLYFSWAYICLSYLAMRGICMRLNVGVSNIVFPIIIIIMCYLNVVGISKIVSFGFDFYPK